MITKEDIRNLANLSRIELSDAEMESMTKEVDSILNYVSQVQNSTADLERKVPPLRNVIREDIVTNEPGQYTEKLLNNAPKREGDYLKVKNIL